MKGGGGVGVILGQVERQRDKGEWGRIRKKREKKTEMRERKS